VLSISTDGVNFTDLPDLPADSNSKSVTGLSPETQYCFRIRAIGAEGDSSPADQVVTTTATP
jgi:chitodextrinase